MVPSYGYDPKDWIKMHTLLHDTHTMRRDLLLGGTVSAAGLQILTSSDLALTTSTKKSGCIIFRADIMMLMWEDSLMQMMF